MYMYVCSQRRCSQRPANLPASAVRCRNKQVTTRVCSGTAKIIIPPANVGDRSGQELKWPLSEHRRKKH